MKRTKIRVTGLLVLSITFGVVGASASNAAPTLAPTPPTLSISPFPKGTIKPQSIATDVGGVTPSSPLTPREIAENIGAITRNAGGIGAIVKIIDVVIITVRTCPQCFLL